MTEAPPSAAGPLAGVVVTDFCWWGVGAIATRMLADFGATVLKIESRTRLDYIRAVPPFPDQLLLPGEVTTVTDFDRSGYFHNHNRNKRSVEIDMKHSRGIEVLRDLIARSDVVSDNFRPGTLERFGLDFDEMRRLNEQIIWVSISGHGQDGPASTYGTNGPVCAALSGLAATAGLPEGPPSGYGYSYMDQCAGYYGSTAILMALYRRARSGGPQRVDLSSVEVGVNFVGPDLLDASVNGRPYDRSRKPSGNRHLGAEASPHGVFPTRGEDRWIAISVFEDEEWTRLVELLGRPGWALDPRYRQQAGRFEHQAELEACLAGWTRDQDRYVLMAQLQAIGLVAGVVQDAEDKARRDPQLRLRDVFPVVPHDRIGPWPVQGVPFKLSASPAKADASGAPLLGADTRDVLTSLLGYAEQDVDELEHAGAVRCGG